jgi:hypothetical protein
MASVTEARGIAPFGGFVKISADAADGTIGAKLSSAIIGEVGAPT